ncbi:HRQ family protein 4 [Spathaspora passalidarum NRRL Y-27907]|uniref:HRQ family protein 4 n=1 Tax=Spathaspora passalidarum (strain NRRL Y-27907 / 11-Y1) TaxID=619300 RepID=G3AGS8_SPAPN|nr:HRQ family protein 4 [Spathaspora passalidarum NRRL Y-27907]EGW35411.1 HRQ family protein 4 [Spathaspora passalidarum NRRL Y-27907]
MLLLFVLLLGLGLGFYWYKHPKNKIQAVPHNFQWHTEKPLPIRPFVNKRNFNPSIGIKNISDQPENWLLIENTYLSNITIRRKHLEANPHQTMQIPDNERTVAALCEFYNLVTGFLTARYPKLFLHGWTGKLHNEITNDDIPFKADPSNPREMCNALGRTIEEDFLILMKDNPDNKEEEYILRAAVNAFPAGFDPSKSYNKPISAIHGPVPQYASRLAFSMHKFFNNLKQGDIWVRHNWSIQTHNQHFNLDSNHGRPGQEVKKIGFDEIDFEQGCFLRVERQAFLRLPNSGAIVMTVRTYLTPMPQIKKEGLGPELCRAIDSLPEDLAYYKKRDAWGEAVKQYLMK